MVHRRMVALRGSVCVLNPLENAKKNRKMAWHDVTAPNRTLTDQQCHCIRECCWICTLRRPVNFYGSIRHLLPLFTYWKYEHYVTSSTFGTVAVELVAYTYHLGIRTTGVAMSTQKNTVSEFCLRFRRSRVQKFGRLVVVVTRVGKRAGDFFTRSYTKNINQLLLQHSNLICRGRSYDCSGTTC
jgi:hypothetical protein